MFLFVAIEQGANSKFYLKVRKNVEETYETFEALDINVWYDDL